MKKTHTEWDRFDEVMKLVQDKMDVLDRDIQEVIQISRELLDLRAETRELVSKFLNKKELNNQKE